jgi:hypothetical protein
VGIVVQRVEEQIRLPVACQMIGNVGNGWGEYQALGGDAPLLCLATKILR